MVFDAGKLVEQGSHQELVSHGGVYANLVRIQTRLGGEDSLEKLLEAEQRAPSAATISETDSAAELAVEESAVAVAIAEPPVGGSDGDSGIYYQHPQTPPGAIPDDFWLDPWNCEFSLDELGRLKTRTEDGEVYHGVYAVRAFPASMPDRFISIRCADADGKEHEIGVIADLNVWPEDAQQLVRDALDRRYRMREIERIVRITEKHNHLYWEVDVKGMGRTSFIMRWQQNAAMDFGEQGKVFSDVDDNLYLVRNVPYLSRREQRMYTRYIFW
jgi:hypothetical protein